MICCQRASEVVSYDSLRKPSWKKIINSMACFEQKLTLRFIGTFFPVITLPRFNIVHDKWSKVAYFPFGKVTCFVWKPHSPWYLTLSGKLGYFSMSNFRWPREISKVSKIVEIIELCPILPNLRSQKPMQTRYSMHLPNGISTCSHTHTQQIRKSLVDRVLGGVPSKETNMSHLGNRKIIDSKVPKFGGYVSAQKG